MKTLYSLHIITSYWFYYHWAYTYINMCKQFIQLQYNYIILPRG